MFRSVVGGAALALCLAASPAAAEPFETFTEHCLANNARQAAVESGLAKSEWFVLPLEMMKYFKNDHFIDPAVYMNLDPHAVEGIGEMPADLEVIVTGRGSNSMMLEMPGAAVELCAVMSPAATPTLLGDKLGRLLGIAPVDMDGERMWFFSRDEGGFRSEANVMDLEEAEALAIIRQRELYMAAPIDAGGMAFLFVAVIRPAN